MVNFSWHKEKKLYNKVLKLMEWFEVISIVIQLKFKS